MDTIRKTIARIIKAGSALQAGIAAIALAAAIGCSGSNGTNQGLADGGSAANSKADSSEKSKDGASSVGNSTATSSPQAHDAAIKGGTAKSSTGSSTAPAEASQWIAALADLDPVRRDEARAKIEALGEGATELLLTALRSGTHTERQGAAFYLMGELHPDDEALVAAFTEGLGDPDPTVRHVALQAVTSLPDDRLTPMVPQLVSMVENAGEQPTTRAEAARLIARLGSSALEAVPALERVATGGDDPRVRTACAFAVSRIAPTEQAVDVLRRLLADEDASMRRLAAARLASFGPAAEPALGELASALGDSEEQVRMTSSDALVRIGRPSVDLLIVQLEDQNAVTRRMAVYTLGRLGDSARPAIAALQRRLNDPDDETKQLTELVLRRLLEQEQQ